MSSDELKFVTAKIFAIKVCVGKLHCIAGHSIATTLRTMNRITAEDTARRFQIQARYDTVPPDEVLDELTRPERARNVVRPKGQGARTGFIHAAAFVLGALILAAAIMFGRWQARPMSVGSTASEAPVERPAARPAPSSGATTVPGPVADPMPTPMRDLVVRHVPRADLVKLPPPRAQLVRLPEWKIGEVRPVMMPYGLEVTACLKGRLLSTSMLPVSGSAIGDTWLIGHNAWVWIAAPGADSANWLDP